MIPFRLFLLALLIGMVAYTLPVGLEYGWNLLPLFFAELKAMTWQGQFNFDFMTFLMLSALWTAWRNNFTPAAFALSVVAFFGGMLFLSVYLLYLSFKTNGDVKTMLIGPRRAAL